MPPRRNNHNHKPKPTSRESGAVIQGVPPAEGRNFAEPRPSPDVTSFDATADSRLHGEKRLEPVPAPRRSPPVMDLEEVVAPEHVAAIQSAGHLLFHTVGDTGGVKHPEPQFLVADKMEEDFLRPGAVDRPAFFYHLGDVVYYFGQKRYYADQFYDPYRHYPAPIFAIPGNHDGDIFPAEPTATLQGFLDNFCAAEPGHSPDAADYLRTVMTQPGVYFTLNAPFVKIIGLYSNATEGPGVISSEGGHNAVVGDEQKQFLVDQLKAAKAERKQGKKFALLVAVHHPPYSGDTDHGGSPRMLQDLDEANDAAGVVPDAYLSGHAHLYQRFTRTVGDRDVPYLVVGTGGYYNLRPMRRDAQNQRLRVPFRGQTAGGKPADHRLEYYAEQRYGFLRMLVTEQYLTGEFYATPHSGDRNDPADRIDAFTVDLNTHKLTAVHTLESAVVKQ